MTHSVDDLLAALHREQWGRLLSLLVARTRRLDLAEDALAEAFARAASTWDPGSPPVNPAGWLYTTAHRHVLGRLRTEAVAGRKAPLLAVRPEWTAPDDTVDELPDERLYLILLCCHPALPAESRSALALRLVIGTPTEQIARLFLVSTSTMAARLTRAQKKIVMAGIPMGAPVETELHDRLDEVCRTIYLAFTAGYTPAAGDALLRADLADDAVRLARVLDEVAPRAPQARALAALLVLQHSRRHARSVDGRLVPLPEQDRSLWRHDEVDRGLALAAYLGPTVGLAEELRLQALIAAEHARAATAEATRWDVIASLYSALEDLTGSPVVRLNRAVAMAEAGDPATAMQLLDGLDVVLPGNHRLLTVRAEVARRLGDLDIAAACYERAIDLAANDVERRHLTDRLASLDR